MKTMITLIIALFSFQAFAATEEEPPRTQLIEVSGETATKIGKFLKNINTVVDYCQLDDELLPSYYNASWICFEHEDAAFTCQQILSEDGTVTIPSVICRDPAIGGRS